MKPSAPVTAATAVFTVLALAGLVSSQSVPQSGTGQARPGLSAPAPGQPTSGSGTSALTQGTGRIGGRVVGADGRPLRTARVMATSAATGTAFGALTDAAGHYDIRDLPGGSFSVYAYKTGYVGLGYGARGPNSASRPLELAKGQAKDQVDFVLPRGCAISGRVLDEFGDPAVEADIEPLVVHRIGTALQTRPVDFGIETDDRGMFRIDGLAPGAYLLAASFQVAPYNVRLLDATNYVRTFYPGGTSSFEAQPLVCNAGEELAGIELGVIRTRTASVSGRVIDSEGNAMSAGAVMMRAAGGFSTTGSLRASLQPGGAFRIPGVAPGDYTIYIVRSSPADPNRGEMAWRRLTIAGGDVTGLLLATSRGATARGAVTSATGNIDFPLSRLSVLPLYDPVSFLPLAGPARAVPKDDGTFELSSLTGRRRLSVTGFPETWTLQAIRLHDEDVTDRLIDFDAGGQPFQFDVVLTNKVTTVSGRVADDRGRDVADYAVAVFSSDEELRYPQSRFTKLVRGGDDGTFKFRALPPGRYYAVALPDLSQDNLMDADYLERLVSIATAFTLGEGENQVLTLKLQTDPGRP